MATLDAVVAKLLSGPRADYFGKAAGKDFTALLSSLVKDREITDYEAEELAMVLSNQIAERKAKGVESFSQSTYNVLLNDFKEKAAIVLNNSLKDFKKFFYDQNDATAAENNFGMGVAYSSLKGDIDRAKKNFRDKLAGLKEYVKKNPLSVKQLKQIKEWLDLFTFIDRHKDSSKFGKPTGKEDATSTRNSLNKVLEDAIKEVKEKNPAQKAADLVASYLNPPESKSAVTVVGGAGIVVGASSSPSDEDRVKGLSAAIAEFNKADFSKGNIDVDPPFTLASVRALWNGGRGTTNIQGLLVVFEGILETLNTREAAKQINARWVQDFVRSVYRDKSFDQLLAVWERLVGQEGPGFVTYRLLILSRLLEIKENQVLPESVTDFMLAHNPKISDDDQDKQVIAEIFSNVFNGPETGAGKRISILNFLTNIGKIVTFTLPVNGENLIRLAKEAEAYEIKNGGEQVADAYINLLLKAFWSGNPTVQDIVYIFTNGNDRLFSMLSQQQEAWMDYVNQLNGRDRAALGKSLKAHEGVLEKYFLDEPLKRSFIRSEQKQAIKEIKALLRSGKDDQPQLIRLVAKADVQTMQEMVNQFREAISQSQHADSALLKQTLGKIAIAMLANERIVNQLSDVELEGLIQNVKPLDTPDNIVSVILKEQSVDNCLRIFNKVSNQDKWAQAVARHMLQTNQRLGVSQFECLSRLEDKYAVFTCLPAELQKVAAKHIAKTPAAGVLSDDQMKVIALAVADDPASLSAIMDKLSPQAIVTVWKELKKTAVEDQLNNFSQVIGRNISDPHKFAVVWTALAKVEGISREVLHGALFGAESASKSQRSLRIRAIFKLPNIVKDLPISELVFLIEQLPGGLENDMFNPDWVPQRGNVDLRNDLRERLIKEEVIVEGMNDNDKRIIEGRKLEKVRKDQILAPSEAAVPAVPPAAKVAKTAPAPTVAAIPVEGVSQPISGKTKKRGGGVLLFLGAVAAVVAMLVLIDVIKLELAGAVSVGLGVGLILVAVIGAAISLWFIRQGMLQDRAAAVSRVEVIPGVPTKAMLNSLSHQAQPAPMKSASLLDASFESSHPLQGIHGVKAPEGSSQQKLDPVSAAIDAWSARQEASQRDLVVPRVVVESPTAAPASNDPDHSSGGPGRRLCG